MMMTTNTATVNRAAVTTVKMPVVFLFLQIVGRFTPL